MKKEKGIFILILVLFLFVFVSGIAIATPVIPTCGDDHTEGMSAYWKLDGDALDSVDDNDGTVSGATFAAGQVGQALSFSSSGDYLVVPSSPSLQLPGDFTLEAWVYPTAYPDLQGKIFTKGSDYWSGNNEYDFLMEPRGHISLTMHHNPNVPPYAPWHYLNGTIVLSLYNWHHVAATFNKSAEIMKLYIDGVEDVNAINDLPINTLDYDLWIGRDEHISSRRFIGNIDEAAIYNRTLTAEEIYQHYINGQAGEQYCTPVPPVCGNSILEAGEECDDGNTISGDGCSATCTIELPEPVVPTCGEGHSADMISYWKADGDASDSVDDNDGTLMGGMGFDPNGVVGQAFSLDGNDYIEIPDSDDWHFGSNDFAITFWARFNGDPSGGSFQYLVNQRTGDITDRGWGFGFDGVSDSFYCAYATSTGTWTDDWIVNWNPAGDTWYHIALVRAGNGIQTYVNGLAVGSTYDCTGDTLVNCGQPVRIGMSPYGGGSEYFNGLIDEVAVFNRALTDSEIQQLYANGNAGQAICTSEAPVPVCGNGVLEAGEECDDGNTVSEDGCSATCQLEITCTDADSDGYATEGGECGLVDCDDNNAAINPGATEVCDGIDNNCNSQIDEGVKTTFYLDADGDGFGIETVSVEECTALEGYVENSGDCDDGNDAINPAAVEVCDGIDNNCDGSEDEGNLDADCSADGCYGGTYVDYYCLPDDGFGCLSEQIETDLDGDGYDIECDGDCVDDPAANPANCETMFTCAANIHPNADEICEDGVDQDCSGADADCSGCDQDNDGHLIKSFFCSLWFGDDCDDTNANVYWGAEEVCDGVDNNCDDDNGNYDEDPSTGIDNRDMDYDGINDCNWDKCLGTLLPEAEVPSESLVNNHYAELDGDSFLEMKHPQQGIINGISLYDSFGCSCEQILECKPGQNNGEKKHGCSQGTMNVWTSQTAWALECQGMTSYGMMVLQNGASKALDEDTDNDGIPDNEDTDDDNDGIPDTEDMMPEDNQQDGIPDWHRNN